MALQAKELQIGDVVMLPIDLLTESGPTFVTRINIQNIAAIDNGQLVAYPIPLTEEMLEKNGWKLSFSCEFYTHKSGRNLKLSNLLGVPSISCFGKISILHYAHEFQHALRLCGLNDLADNLKV